MLRAIPPPISMTSTVLAAGAVAAAAWTGPTPTDRAPPRIARSLE